MATVMPARRRRAESFRIHEDAPSTEDTEMNESALQDDDGADQDGEPLDEDGHESEYSESSEEDAPDDSHFQADMEKLQDAFAGFRQKYRLIKRIGEGSRPPVRLRLVPEQLY
jgi:cell division control protein 7